MGGSASTTQEQVTKDTANTLIKIAQTCQAQAQAAINVQAGTVDGNVTIGGTISQSTSATTTCQQGAQLNAMLQASLAQTVSQSAKADGFSLWGSSKAVSKTVHETLSTLDMNVFQQCKPTSDSSMTTSLGVVKGNLTWAPNVTQAVQTQIFNCVQQNEAIQKDISTVVSSVNNQAETGLSLGLGGIISIIVAFIALIIIAAVVLKFMRSNSSSLLPVATVLAGAGAGVSAGAPAPSKTTQTQAQVPDKTAEVVQGQAQTQAQPQAQAQAPQPSLETAVQTSAPELALPNMSLGQAPVAGQTPVEAQADAPAGTEQTQAPVGAQADASAGAVPIDASTIEENKPNGSS